MGRLRLRHGEIVAAKRWREGGEASDAGAGARKRLAATVTPIERTVAARADFDFSATSLVSRL